MPAPDRLRQIPSVASLLALEEIRFLLARHPRAVVVGAIRRLLDRYRSEALGEKGREHTREEWTSLLVAALPAEVSAGEESPLRRVINATGVVHVEQMLLALTGAQSVHVVNNNAAAVFLCLTGLARGRDVIVSRGELVEIGGSFRIPEIMAASGANLVEVGTTNRTRLADYERAIGPSTALLLKVHPSNFRITGFTEEVTAADLAALGKRLRIPVMEDLGSGAVFDFAQAGIPGTPTIRQALAQGPGIVTVSGDKLLGGPQAGIIAGWKDLVDPLKQHPLSRALRIDKLCLAALSATLQLYADDRWASARLPFLRMILEEEKTVRARAWRLVARVRREQSRALRRDASSAGEIGRAHV